MSLEDNPNMTPTRVRSNFEGVLERVHRAAERSGRTRDSVRVVGVTKYVDATVSRWLVEAGCTELGEARPQALWEKSQQLNDLDVSWHLIGHLQRNKAKRTLPLLAAMHSLDSLRLLNQIQTDIGIRPRPLELLLEINVSQDSSKTGLSTADGEAILAHWVSNVGHHPGLGIVGLMGMGGLGSGPEQARRDFAELRILRDRWANRFGLPLTELSMGMSEDYEIAIEEGATLVRVGSVLFS